MSETDEKSMKELRKENPSGIGYLFAEPSMRFVLDALLDLPPDHTFTTEELAGHAGISKSTLYKLLPKLRELGIIREVDSGEATRYALQEASPVRYLHLLNSVINFLRTDKGQQALDRLEDLPEQRYSYWCENCGVRGEYKETVFAGHVLECPADETEWLFTGEDPPGYVEAFHEMLENASNPHQADSNSGVTDDDSD